MGKTKYCFFGIIDENIEVDRSHSEKVDDIVGLDWRRVNLQSYSALDVTTENQVWQVISGALDSNGR